MGVFSEAEGLSLSKPTPAEVRGLRVALTQGWGRAQH